MGGAPQATYRFPRLTTATNLTWPIDRIQHATGLDPVTSNQ